MRMSKPTEQERDPAQRTKFAFMLMLVLVSGIAYTWWTIGQADRSMRKVLLEQTQLVAQSISTDRLKELTGSEADWTSTHYLRLKEQLARTKETNDKCKFIYILGRRDDGSVYFIVDNEPVGSPDEAPAGLLYDDMPEGFLPAFESKEAVTAGPFTDRWGTFVSGAVPILDPVSKETLAVLAMDLDAGSWKWDQFAHAAPPIGLMMVLLSVLTSWMLANQPSRKVSIKPIRNRLLVPIAVMLLLLIGCFVGALVYLHQMNLERSSFERLTAASADLEDHQKDESRMMSALTDVILCEEDLRAMLKNLDRDNLLKEYQGMFRQLKTAYGISHFYFHRPDRVNLLRLHQPEKSGDVIDRFTAVEAERTQDAASGLELGPLGTFTLRHVRPVFEGDALVGYIELGKEIEDILESVSDRHNLELAVLIRKDALIRDQWESGMKMLGRKANWDRFAENVMIYSSMRPFPVEFDPLKIEERVWKVAEAEVGERSWHVLKRPLVDVSGTEVGDLIVLHDTSVAKSEFRQFVLGLAGVSLVLLAALFGFLYVLLFRTDRGIGQQQTELLDSKERFDQLAEQSRTIVWEVDENGVFTYVSHVVEEVLGYRPEDLIGRFHFYDLHPETGRDELKTTALLIFERRGRIDGLENVLETKDGNEIWVSTIGLPILSPEGALLGYRGSDTDITERKRMEIEIRESEGKFRALFETSSDAVMLIGDDGYIDCNDATLQMFGFESREEFCRKHPADLSPSMQAGGGDSRTLARERIATAITEGSNRFEWIHRRTDGTDFPTEVLLNALEIQGARVLQAVVRDISERERAAKELREREERLRKILDSVQTGIVIVDRNTHEILDVNPAAVELIGAAEEDIVGKVCHKFICPAEVGACPISDLGQTVDNSERVLVRANGEEIPILKTVVPIEISGRSCLLDCFVDLSERKQAEKELRDREKVFGAISESAQDAIVMIDSEGKVTHWNKAAERIFQYSADEMLGQVLHEHIAPEALRIDHLAAFGKFCETGQGAAVGKTLELPGMRKDGTEVPVELSLSAARLDGQWHAIGIMRDITERRIAEERLQKAKQDAEEAAHEINDYAQEMEWKNLELEMARVKAEEATRAKSEFLANMSHEIRTPMNGVIGMTGLLLDTELTEEQREFAETVRTSGDALLSLINDILDFSKIEAGRLDLEAIDFDLRMTLDDTSDILALRAQEKGLEFICFVEPEVPSLLRGDPGRLRQVLINLTGNAIKFTSEGEVSIRVCVEREEEDEVILRFSVSDTGIGIAEDQKERLFEAFTQADGSITRKFGGTGLGLSISKRIVELMDGEMGVESVLGEGSTFWFTAVLGKQLESAAAPDIPQADISGERVLVVDDNATNRRWLRALLKTWKCRADDATDAETAYQKLLSAQRDGDPFRIAILDMQMPGMDGETLGKKIKNDPEVRETLLVMMTSLGERGDAARLEGVGFSAYLTKPIKQSILRDSLESVLGSKKEAAVKSKQPIITRHLISEAKRGKVRILLAEDNTINRKVALKMLENLGYRADAVANGLEAIQSLEMLPYDLVLMDCQMPEMDGYEATRRIRDPNSEILAHDIPIIAMTAHAMQGDREKCLEAGMNDYLSKPVLPQALSEVLEKWLNREGAESLVNSQ